MAHGYANFASGIFGGLQNYITYSNSVLYAKSGGNGKFSSVAIVALTMVLFVIGPQIASYLPRCMAGTLLFHIGIDLILEGVYDSFGNYDYLEYTGIWVIALVMTTWGMTAALIAGVIAALSTYAVQSINHQDPIRQILSAATLRSSDWNRCATARAILEDDVTGRSRILVFQLQGHIFFGNIAQLTDTIKEILKEKEGLAEMPLVVIVDFTLVVGMDSSAAHAVAKLKKIIHRLFGVEVSIFVTGSGRGGFPCEYALTEALCPEAAEQIQGAGIDWNDMPGEEEPEVQQPHLGREESARSVNRGSISVSPGTASVAASQLLSKRTDGQVCESLDEALRFAEDILIAREKPSLVHSDSRSSCIDISDLAKIEMTLQEEQYHAKKYIKELFSSADVMSSDAIDANAELLLSFMERKEYLREQALWEQGDDSDCAQLLVVGELVSIIEDTGASEPVKFGNMVGELGLVHEAKRLTTLLCSSEKAVLYSLSRRNWHIITTQYPQLARMVDAIVIRYLAHRVQHVSNRYFHTTLPV
jgi:SulP family sulfate permease